MIELDGHRYAVGPGPIRLITVAAVLATGEALFYAAGPVSWWFHVDVLGEPSDVFGAATTIAVVCGAFVFFSVIPADSVIGGAVSQKIAVPGDAVVSNEYGGPAGWRRIAAQRLTHRWDRVTAGSGVSTLQWLWMVGIAAPLLPILVLLLCRWLPVPRVLAVAVMPALAIIASSVIAVQWWRLRNRLRRQSTIRADGGWLDLFHGWDFDRVDTSDDALFRERYGSQWKPANKIIEAAEAAGYAATARAHRVRVMASAAAITITGTVFVADPLKQSCARVWHYSNPAPSTIEVFYLVWPVMFFGAVLLLPFMLTQKAEKLSELFALYDSRRAELSQVGITASAVDNASASEPTRRPTLRVGRYRLFVHLGARPEGEDGS